jgi:acyl dehydratase
MFGQRVVHGHACASVISGILGGVLPGPGSIYLSQSLHYRAPVFVDEWIETTVTVQEIREDRNHPIVTLRTELRKDDGTLVTEGEAVGLCPQFARQEEHA